MKTVLPRLESLCLIFLCLLFLSCGSVPQASQEYRGYLRAPAQKGRIVVYRLKSPPYVARTLVSVGGQSVKLPNNSFTVFDVPAGEHRLKVDWAWDTALADREIILSVRSGETKYARVHTTVAPLEGVTIVGMAAIPNVGSGGSELYEMPAAIAEADLAFTRYAR